MSSYRIILNLTGNASAKVTKLTKDLIRADAAAKSLAAHLTGVSAAARTIPHIGSSGGGYGGRSRGNPKYSGDPNRSRIASFGVGGNFGPFSGRLGTVLTPDANGNIFGMNAAKLMKGANVAALVGSMLTFAAKSAIKVVGATTLAPLAIGGGVLMGAIRAVQSEGFKDGVRLISRERQAKLGLGDDYERGQRGADFLAASYGFDRSTTLSSINVLSGMGIGGTSRKLTTGEATGLTKVGGLISQQSGVSFERVMTNIQQLLVQTTPHVRDIREMLNQAPILGKYALKDMEEKGVTGVDTRTWLKDQNNIMSVLKRYEIDLASNAGMRASGKITLAQQDAWKKIAGNDKSWEYLGYSAAKMISTFAESLNKLLSVFTDSPAFMVMVERLNVAMETAAAKGTVVDEALGWVEKAAQRYGISLGDEGESRRRVEQQLALGAAVGDPTIQGKIMAYAEGKEYFRDVPESVKDEAMRQLMSEIYSSVRSDSSMLANTAGVGALKHAGAFENKDRIGMYNYGVALNKYLEQGTGYINDSTYRYPSMGDYKSQSRSDLSNPTAENAVVDVNTNELMRLAYAFIDKTQEVGKIPTIDNQGAPTGESLTGFNKDRRALEIHFHAPIVEWNNTMESTSPQETVDAVADNIENLAAAAIQKALLGASNKMSTQWY